jgi:hypothetical protein
MTAQNLNMGAALWGLTDEAQFALLRKSIVDHELVETNDVVLRFQGTLKPRPRAVVALGEGERDWKAWDMETVAELPEDSIVADFSGKQYRVMSLTDWSRSGGYYTYVLQEQPAQGAPAAAYAIGPREPALVVADILQNGLGLDADAVVLAYEKNLIPKRTGLYVSIDYVGPTKVIANVNEFEAGTGREIQSATLSYLIQMDLLSYDASARRRFKEAAMALASVYAVQQMEKYGLSINRNPSPFVDASSLEPTKRLNRFISTMVVFGSVRKVVPDPPFYQTFPGQLTTGGPLTPLTPAPLEI